MTSTLADAISDRLDEMAAEDDSLHWERFIEGHRAHLDFGRNLVRLALELDLDGDLPCFVARSEGRGTAGPFDTVSEANAWIGCDDLYDVEQITIKDAARLFASCSPRVPAAPTPLVALLTLPARFKSLAGA